MSKKAATTRARGTRDSSLKSGLSTGRVKFAGHYEVVGGYYHDLWEAKVDGVLKEGTWLQVNRDKNNSHDQNAIVIHSYTGKHLIGYIKREEAAKLAPFLDVGIKAVGRVFSVTGGVPLRLVMRLYIKR